MWAKGQTNAEDYFHKGAQYYIFGEKTNAAKAIYTGLRNYPNDPPLNAVAKLLQKKDPEDQNQSKNSQQNQKQDQDKDKKQQQQPQKQQDKKSDEQKKEEDKAKQEQAKKDQEKKEQKKKDQMAQANKDEQKDKPDEKSEAASAAELHMSPQEARQLLDQLKDDSKVLLFTPTNQPINSQRGKFKDW